MNYKNHSLILMISAFSMPLFLFGFLTYVDIYQLRKHKSYSDTKFEISKAHMKINARGIINNVEFDGLIAGTSLLNNTSALQASKKLGGKFVNLSMDGTPLIERYDIIKYALERKKLKSVIFSLDVYEFPSYPDKLSARNQIYKILYDRNPLNDLFIYDKKSIKSSITWLFQKTFNKDPKREIDYTYFDRPNSWYDIPSCKERFGGIENWIKNKDHPQISNLISEVPIIADLEDVLTTELQMNEERYQITKNSLDEPILDLVQKHPDVHFYILLTPTSRISFKSNILQKSMFYPIYKAYVEYFVKEVASRYKNIELYGFDDTDYPDDLGNYKDLAHYNVDMNDYMISSLKDKKHLLKPDNIDQFFETVSQKIDIYDIKKINDQIQRLLLEK
ncbi:MAG: hypothetical protein ACRCS8_00635 [Brevinema sp.]